MDNDYTERTKTMIEEIKQQWITALTDGSYVQGLGALSTFDSEDEKVRRDCCLGVLSDLAVKAGIVTSERRYDESLGCAVLAYIDSEGREFRSYLPGEVVAWAGLEDREWQHEATAYTQDTEGTYTGFNIAVTPGDHPDVATAGRYNDRTLAGLNDDEKTFTAIAAVVATF